MNQAAVIFEISSIALLLLIGLTLSTVSIDSTGVVSVAGLLSLFFVTSHYKALLRIATHFGAKPAFSAASTSNISES